ncbi:hypothetical protein ABT336_09920 [Micromonospora sp. NPDC000207]|uniref:hypothetical protein n=1 Tax=Micromonospora sp. NPDC000207 TaxID=3154246 RepID=UPI003332DE1B
MLRRIAGVSVLAVLAGLAVSAPVQAASEFRTITREGVVLQFQRVAKATTPMKGTGATRSDFDGDGVDDIAVSSRTHTFTGPRYASGVVVVRYSSAPQVDYFIGALVATPEVSGGSLGDALVAGDFNADGYDDLAIGDSDEVDPGNRTRAGGVWVVPGSRNGLVLDAAKHFNQSSPGVPGAAENYDWFGNALAAGDINGDGRDDLAIGAAGEAIGTKDRAGAVTVLYGGTTGLTATGAQQFHQDQAAVPGSAERNDQFGRTLAIGKFNKDRYADLVIGAPWENDGDVPTPGSGMVTLMWGAASGVRTTGATSVTGGALQKATGRQDNYVWYLGESLAAGDVDGDGLAEVIAGAPRSQTPHLYGGLVVAFTGRSGGLSNKAVRIIGQRTAGVPGDPEYNDQFGGTLAVGDVTGDGRADVLVGSPGEAIGKTTEAGMVTLLKGSASGLTGSGAQGFDQGHSVVPGAPEKDDRFGSAVALLNLNGTGGLDAIVTANNEEVAGDTKGYGSGMVAVFHGAKTGLVPKTTSWSGRSLNTDRMVLQTYGSRVVAPNSGGLWY